jgi:hypothetical protein
MNLGVYEPPVSSNMVFFGINIQPFDWIGAPAAGIVTSNIWNHYALTWGAQGKFLYLNGSVITSSSDTRAMNPSTAIWEIGAEATLGNDGFNGVMDELRISNIQRVFSPATYTITTSASPSGGGTITGSGTYTFETLVTVTATPNAGFSFLNWTETGTVVSTSASYSFTANTNLSLVANFSPTPFAITAITKKSNDILVTWTCIGGLSNVLQSTKSTAMIAGYNTNFTDISPIIVLSGLGPTTTNYLDVGATSAPVLPAPGSHLSTTSIVPSTVQASAQYTRGLADSLGQAVPIGSKMMLGTFGISESAIQSNFVAGNLEAVMSTFAEYTNLFYVGDGTSEPASWNTSRSAPGFAGKQIYLLAVNTPSFAAATECGIFTAPSWVFPPDGGTNTIDLEDVTDFVVGSQGGSLTIGLPLNQTYTFTDTARLSVLPGRILFYRVRLAQ